MNGVPISVHEHDRHRSNASVHGLAEQFTRALFIKRDTHVTLRGDALIDLDHSLIKHRG